MHPDLETKLNDQNQYRSAGERHIAAILTKYGIPFQYESPVLVRDKHNLMRIWYPDFFIPHYGLYIEYFGLAGRPEYDSVTSKKCSAYNASGVQVVILHAQNCRPRYERELLARIDNQLASRLDSFRYHVGTGALKEPRRLDYR